MAGKNKKYSSAEQKAYYMGLGASLGRGGKIKSTMESLSAPLKESFKNGLDQGLSNPKKPVFKKTRRLR